MSKMPNKFAPLLLYLLILPIYFVILKGLADLGKNVTKTMADKVSIEQRQLGQFQLYFFTIWNFILQIIFAVTTVLDESSKLLNLPLSLQKRLGRTRAYLFNTFIFPCSLLVMTIFWGLWNIDRELIFPKVIDTFFPTWLNHGLHTFIIVPVIVESFLPKKHHFVEFKRVVPVLAVFMTTYQLLYLSVYLRYGVWLYPIYKYLNWPLILAYSLVQLATVLIYQKVGITLQVRRSEANAGKIR